MIYKIISKVFYIIGTASMFIPIITNRLDMNYIFITGGLVIATIGVILMGANEEEKELNEDILDDGEF